jgi:hypothetical protein
MHCTNQAISFDGVGVEEVAHVIMEGDPLPHSSYVKTSFIWTSGREGA